MLKTRKDQWWGPSNKEQRREKEGGEGYLGGTCMEWGSQPGMRQGRTLLNYREPPGTSQWDCQNIYPLCSQHALKTGLYSETDWSGVVCEHQTKTSQDINWKWVKSHQPGVNRGRGKLREAHPHHQHSKNLNGFLFAQPSDSMERMI